MWSSQGKISFPFPFPEDSCPHIVLESHTLTLCSQEVLSKPEDPYIAPPPHSSARTRWPIYHTDLSN